MARRRTHDDAIRNRLITIRLTDADHLRLKEEAARQGTTVSGLAERLVLKGRIVISAADAPERLDPRLLAELRRIGNNLNQLAHAVNSNLPPVIPQAAKHMHDLLTLLVRDELLARRINDLRTREIANDSEAPSARDEFQRNVQIRSP